MPHCKQITAEEYHDGEDSNQGYCTNCQEFTHDRSEPDAERYECPDCGRETVYGIVSALLAGFITIID